MRKLIVDCQILQTPAYDRGMGKYTLSLLEAFLAQNKASYEPLKIQLLLSSNLENSPERIKAIRKRLKGTETVFLNLPTNIAIDMQPKYAAAEKTIDDYIIRSSQKDDEVIFLVMAPFFVGFPAVFPSVPNVQRFSIVYDIIPQKIWHLQRIFPDDIYFNHYKLFLQADHLFTISQSVKSDLLNIIGVPEHRLTSIDGGPFMRVSFTKKSSASSGLKQPYILFPSAPIVHKNNERAVNAFAQFNKANSNRFTLYITSSFDDSTQEKLKALSPHLSFTGNISDGDLKQAYAGAEALLFPSLAEGLGMPVLEAAIDNVPVACSRIPVLSELSENAFYQFNPNDVEDIASVLDAAVKRVDWAMHKNAYKTLKQTYTWHRSAKILLSELSKKFVKRSVSKTSLQVVFPNPTYDSAAGYLGELLYARLQEKYQVVLQLQPTNKVNRSSYTAYLPQGTISGAGLKLVNKRRSLNNIKRRIYPVTLEYTPDNKQFRKNNLTFYARRTFSDEALQLKGWEYIDHSGSRVTLSGIIDALIENK